MTKTYKPKDVLLTVGGVEITGFMDSGKVSIRRNTMAKNEIKLSDPRMAVTKAQKISIMFAMQEKVNREAFDGENWFRNQRPWYRAAWMEAAELLDHYGYKWWKMDEPDLAQAQMELVDIWHFAMSEWIQKVKLLDRGVGEMYTDLACAGIVKRIESERFKYVEAPLLIEALVADTIVSESINLEYLAPIFQALDMDVDKLYKMYVGKNALNRFRQGHGYQEGTYAKLWGGKEDNVWLAQILEVLDGDNPNFYDNLLRELNRVYSNCTKGHGVAAHDQMR